MNSRRQFVKIAGIGALVAGFAPASAMKGYSTSQMKAPDAFTIGMAGYTFREFSVDDTIAMMKRIGVNNLSLKDFHMAMNSTQEQINQVIAKFRDGGINVYTVGV